MHQPNTPFKPASPIKPTPPALPIFSIQRPVASHSDAKRKPTGIQTRRNRQPNASQRASRCGKSAELPTCDKKHIALHIALHIVFVFYFNRKQNVKYVTLLVQKTMRPRFPDVFGKRGGTDYKYLLGMLIGKRALSVYRGQTPRRLSALCLPP